MDYRSSSPSRCQFKFILRTGKKTRKETILNFTVFILAIDFSSKSVSFFSEVYHVILWKFENMKFAWGILFSQNLTGSARISIDVRIELSNHILEGDHYKTRIFTLKSSIITMAQQEEVDRFLQEMMAEPFITDEMFEELVAPKRKEKTAEDTIDWCELPINVIYLVKFLVPVQTNYGTKILLMLTNQEGTEIKVWSPANVSKELKVSIKLSNNIYIKSLGEKIGTTSSGKRKRYFDFETAYT